MNRYLVFLLAVVSLFPLPAAAQDFWIWPDDIQQGECYVITGWTPYITLDVVYYIDWQGPFEAQGFVSLDHNAQSPVCTDSSTPTGSYWFTGVRETGTYYYFDAYAWLNIRPASPSYPQPTSLSFSAPSGYAGNDNYTMTAGDGAGMTIDVEYTLNGVPQDIWSTSLDSNGQWFYSLNHYDAPGTYRFYRIKNALNTDWIDIDTSYTVLPPQPTAIAVDPSQGAAGQGHWNLQVANGAEMALDMRYTLNGAPLPDIIGWPWLSALSPWNPNGGAFSIPLNVCTVPGFYRFTHVRNHLNGGDSQWVPTSGANFMTVYPPGPPTVTSAAPLGGYPGTTVSVTLNGSNLCGVSLSSHYPGLSFNPVPNDPYSNGASVVAQINIAAGALPGAAAVNVTANGGATSFTFHVGGVPMPTVLSKESIYLGNSILAVESP